MIRGNYISLINPQAFQNFNLTQGTLAGQRVNANTQALQAEALAQSQTIRDLNASLEFENQFRNARAQNPRASLASLLGSTSNAVQSPFAALQGFNAQASVQQALLNQQAGQANLSLVNGLLGQGGFGQLNNSLAGANAARVNSYDYGLGPFAPIEDPFGPQSRSLVSQTAESVERTNSRGARQI